MKFKQSIIEDLFILIVNIISFQFCNQFIKIKLHASYYKLKKKI